MTVYLVGAGPGDPVLLTTRALQLIAAADVIVYGHTHRSLVMRNGSRLAVNPGSAGPRRFDLHPSVGVLTIVEGEAEVEIIDIA